MTIIISVNSDFMLCMVKTSDQLYQVLIYELDEKQLINTIDIRGEYIKAAIIK